MRTRSVARSEAAAPRTLVSLPDEELQQVISACRFTGDGAPLFEVVKGLGCLSKRMRQQLHRLRPVVGVRSLAVVQRPNHGPWRVTLLYEGDLTAAVPLVGTHHRGESVSWLEMPEFFQLRVKQYTASVAVDDHGRTALVSCPRGNLIGCWDLHGGRFQQQLVSQDAAGLFRLPGGGWISSNGYGQVNLVELERKRGTMQRPLAISEYRWDNHLTVI